MKYLKKFNEEFFFPEEERKSTAQLIASDEIATPKGFKPSENTSKKGQYNVKDGIVAWIDKSQGHYRSEDTKQRAKHQGNSESELISSLEKNGYELQPLLPCELDPRTKVGYGSDRTAN